MTQVLQGLLTTALATSPNKIALHIAEQHYTFQELDHLSNQIAQHLLANDLTNKQMAILLPNSLELVLLYLACLKAGVTAIPVNYRLATSEIQRILNDCEPHWLITDSAEKLTTLQLEQTTISQIFTVGNITQNSAQSFDCLLQPVTEPLPFPDIQPDHDSVILYTSGSTGTPKGVVHTHLSLSEAFFHIQPIAKFDADSIMLVAGPIYHAGALAEQLLPMLYYGGTLILLPQYNIDVTLSAFQQYRPTHFQSNPITLQEIIAHPQFKTTDFTDLHYYLVGGDSVAADLLTQFHEHTGLTPYQAFGCTEAFVNIINQEQDPGKWGAIGRPLLTSNIRILDENDQDCAVDQPGEMLIQAPTQMKYYWQAPDKTAQAMHQGFYRTGDIVYRDQTDLLWFASRKKHIIIRKGSNIWPKEIEQVLLLHPAVEKAGVVALPSETEGEVPYAFITVANDHPIDTAALLAFLQPQLAEYKWPVKIKVINSMPIGNTGKVDRKMLQIMLRERTS